MYEFWQNTNGYGLVEMLKRRGDNRMVGRERNPDSESEIHERRQTDQRVLLILRDFVNYKTRLAEIDCMMVDTNKEGTEIDGEQLETGA